MLSDYICKHIAINMCYISCILDLWKLERFQRDKVTFMVLNITSIDAV